MKKDNESDNRKRVLFVDDEPRILDGIRRMMRPLHEEWDMRFANSGYEALEMLSQEDFDVIVSDMRMPGMSGAELLAKVQQLYPQMVRIVLSGAAQKDAIMRSVRLIHQYLAKPCDVDTLRSAVIRSTNLRDLLQSPKIKSVVSQTGSLPSLPTLYLELTQELKKPEASMKVIERIISQDLGMATKVLQLVNSAFFGVRRHVSSPGEAVRLLGLDTIETLVLSVQVFSQFDGVDSRGLSLQQVWEHSMLVGSCSKAIAAAEKAETMLVDNAFIGGLLHDVGKLIIASRFSKEYQEVMQRIESGAMSQWAAEKEVIGASHAEIGAYLLGLWGFSDPIVEAAAFHHHPTACVASVFSPLAAVHAANAVVHEIEQGDTDRPSEVVDTEYLQKLGLSDRLPLWREICVEKMKQREGQ